MPRIQKNIGVNVLKAETTTTNNLNVTNDATITGDLTVSGSGDLIVDNIDFTGAMTIGDTNATSISIGAGIITTMNDLTLTGDVIVGGDLDVAGHSNPTARYYISSSQAFTSSTVQLANVTADFITGSINGDSSWSSVSSNNISLPVGTFRVNGDFNCQTTDSVASKWVQIQFVQNGVVKASALAYIRPEVNIFQTIGFNTTFEQTDATHLCKIQIKTVTTRGLNVNAGISGSHISFTKL